MLSEKSWQPGRLACSNYIDAMAMIRKAAWAASGGYTPILGRADYELWMKFVEKGFWAVRIPEVLALYRNHSESMVHTLGAEDMKKSRLWQALHQSHPWIAVPTWSQVDDL